MVEQRNFCQLGDLRHQATTTLLQLEDYSSRMLFHLADLEVALIHLLYLRLSPGLGPAYVALPNLNSILLY